MLQQLSALIPLASTLTHLDLSDLQRWEGRPATYSEDTLRALRQLTRCDLAVQLQRHASACFSQFSVAKVAHLTAWPCTHIDLSVTVLV